MENPEDYNLTPEQQEFETSMHLKIMETYGMGKPVQAAVVIASTGGMLVLLRNRGLAVKVIVSPMIGFTAGTAVNAACFMNNVKSAINDGSFQREIPDSLTKEMMLMAASDIPADMKNDRIKEVFMKLQQRNNSQTPISDAVQNDIQTDQYIPPTDSLPPSKEASSTKPKRYNKYGDEIQDE